MEPNTQKHAERKASVGYWQRILIVNAVGALAAFGLIGGLVTEAPWSERWKALVTCFVYANSIGGIMASVMPPILRRFGGPTKLRRWVVQVVAIPVLTVAGCLVAGIVGIAIGVSRPDQYWAYLYGSLRISFVVGTAACLTVMAYETLRGELEATTLALRTTELEKERARKLAIEAQLASLESRIHPHFLFNTLNSIAALTHDDAAGAERMTNQLASLMRSSLDGASTPLVPLEQELRVVGDYLDIERVRFANRLRYTLDVPDVARAALVPRLSLQTLVENSVKSAVAPRREGASIVVRAAASDGRLRLEVEDDGPGFDPHTVVEGHGLAVLRSRLAMTFGDRATLRIDSRPGRTCVTIDLPR